MSRVRRTIWRHPEWSAVTLVIAAWIASSRGMRISSAPGMRMDMHGGAAMHSSGSAFGIRWIAAWLVMSTAMMVPTALPTIRHLALTARWHRRQSTVALFVSGYLAVWMSFGITAAGFVALVRHLGSFGAVPLATAALFAAAVWELTPWKRRALRACRLVAPLPPRGRNANRACVKASVRQALWCTASCWCLMLAIVANLAGVYVMGVLTAVIVAENVAARGPRFTLPAAGVIACVALVLAVA